MPEYVAVPAANVVALPTNCLRRSRDSARCGRMHVPQSRGTRAGSGIGQNVLISGVGGLGIHGVQIARLAGAEVIATSRRLERLKIAGEFGAIPAEPRTESLKDRVRELTRGEGMDVVVDNIGTRASVREALSLLRPGGKLLVVAYLNDTFEVPSIPFFKTEQEIIGCRGSSKQDLEEVVRLAGSGKLKPVIGAHYPLEQIAAAVERLERGDLVGRIVLTQE